MIDGRTEVIAHIGYPTHAFRAPLIYNPWFEHAGVNAVVVPMGCRAEDFPGFLPAVFTLSNLRGALITMPHKISTVALLDRMSPAVAVAGACNAVRRAADGALEGDLFDGEGFVRGLQRRGFELPGCRALVLGCGGVGSAIAAALASRGAAHLRLSDPHPGRPEALAQRLWQHYPALGLDPGTADPAGVDLVVNATPLGMSPDDPLPLDCSRLDPGTFVGEVVMRRDLTPLLEAARARGCPIQLGVDMLFEQIPAYLEFFGLPVASPDLLRALARAPAED
jgi:shikimate dehydrogenase